MRITRPDGLSTRLELLAVAVQANDDLVAVQGDRGIFSGDVHVGARRGVRFAASALTSGRTNAKPFG
jgi:hypothetical protein